GGLTLAGTAGLLGLHPRPVAAEPPPETTALRLARTTSICQAPQYVVEALFEAEGFTDVQFVGEAAATDRTLVSGDAQMGMLFLGPFLLRLDEGAPLVILSGGHVGCLEVFAYEPIRSIRDLKGKSVAVIAVGSTRHVFLATIMAYIGLDPRKDGTMVVHPHREAVRRFEEQKVDAYIAAPPEAQELRAKKIGHVVVNSSVDRPWSQYFCCVVAGHREFVQKHPIATKRALRAILKGADICALEPERAARSLVHQGLAQHYDYALQTMQEVPYGRWREYDPEDTVRFYALRLHEVGMIKSTPQKLIAQGTDWRFLNALKKELKG
ncbi:MAG TPA: ABC transporter substrate-binding protein, partial [Rubrobacter sp.]|nr:ABC transporter substrate-binding protein [Rubrobacter sp.]